MFGLFRWELKNNNTFCEEFCFVLFCFNSDLCILWFQTLLSFLTSLFCGYLEMFNRHFYLFLSFSLTLSHTLLFLDLFCLYVLSLSLLTLCVFFLSLCSSLSLTHTRNITPHMSFLSYLSYLSYLPNKSYLSFLSYLSYLSYLSFLSYLPYFHYFW
jgi:hypothetical protein